MFVRIGINIGAVNTRQIKRPRKTIKVKQHGLRRRLVGTCGWVSFILSSDLESVFRFVSLIDIETHCTIALIPKVHKSGDAQFGQGFRIRFLHNSLLQWQMMDLNDPRIRAPEFPPSVWLNTYSEVSLRSLQPNIVLLDFWDYTRINCLRTMPYLRAWYERYHELGFEIVGVHTPEFPFARHHEYVKSAIGRLGMRWPVILDNNQHVWTSYANRYWPTIYLIDAQGNIRFRHAGEGVYAQIETAIQTLLHENKSDLEFPPLITMFRGEDAPGAISIPTTQELHIDSLADPLPDDDIPKAFSLPCDLADGHFYLEGLWRLDDDGLTLSGESGTIMLPYHAADVYAVLSPHSQNDPGIPFDHNPHKIEVIQDGQPLPDDLFGQDIYKINDRSLLRIDTPRNYHLVHNPAVQDHQLQLRSLETGLTFFAFSFGSCITTETGEDSDR